MSARAPLTNKSPTYPLVSILDSPTLLLEQYENALLEPERYKAIIFTDGDNCGKSIEKLIEFSPASVLVINIFNSKTLPGVKLLSHSWIINISTFTSLPNEADMYICMEMRSCIDYFRLNADKIRYRAHSPLHILAVSGDHIFQAAVATLSSLCELSFTKEEGLEGSILCSYWNGRLYSLPLFLMLTLPAIVWPDKLAFAARQTQCAIPSIAPCIDQFETFMGHLAELRNLPGCVSKELAEYKKRNEKKERNERKKEKDIAKKLEPGIPPQMLSKLQELFNQQEHWPIYFDDITVNLQTIDPAIRLSDWIEILGSSHTSKLTQVVLLYDQKGTVMLYKREVSRSMPTNL